MVESRQEDARIYIVSILFFVCIFTGGTFLCLYMFQPEAESAPSYPVAGIILVSIPWIFWIATCVYKCCAYCFCQSKGEGNVNRVQSSSTETQSCASAEPVGRSMHSSENGDPPLKSPNGDHRHVHFGEVVMMGRSENSQNDNGGESPHEDTTGYPETEHEDIENSHDSITSDKDNVSAACVEGEAPLIVSISS